MRQTGRTTRIVNFTVDQLFSIGEVIVTDHISFEFEHKQNGVPLHYFIDNVKERVMRLSGGRKSVTAKSIRLIRGSKLEVVHFTLITKK
tara:strand:- start:108 stop:374 length:267 start_codon:yes stop_codon:yes gene_type:complete